MRIVEVADDLDGAALQCRRFRGWPDIDEGNRVRRDARGLGEGRPHHARGVAGRIADLAARKILRTVHAIALEPIEGLAGIGIDAHQRDGVGALAAGHQHGRKIGDPERSAARSHLERGDARALADFDAEIDSGLLIPAHGLGVIERRVVGGRCPVQNEADALAGMRADGRRDEREGRGSNLKTFQFSLLFLPSLRGALATKQSSFPLWCFKKAGLLRCARNDEVKFHALGPNPRLP